LPGFRAFVAVSLDGYLADADGSIAWLAPFMSLDYGFDAFYANIGTMVMGRATYDHLHQMGHWPQREMRTIVVTSRTMDTAPDSVETWAGDVSGLVEDLRRTAPADVWVAGGAKAIRAFMDLGAIRHLDLLVMPVLLGQGRPLFIPSDRGARLALLTSKTYANGVVKLSYVVGV
jgi:dihydrofolate reductase